MACSYTCLTCSSTNCGSCDSNSHRTLVSGACPCDQGYFNTGTLRLCGACNPSCLACTGPGSTNCTSCNVRYFNNSGTCTACDITCYACNGVLWNNCIFCDNANFRSLTSSGTC